MDGATYLQQLRYLYIPHLGRPVAVVMSFEDYQASMQTIASHVAALVSESYPLRGKAAGDSMRQHLASMSNLAAEEGLTPADVTRMLREP